jgi:hypothetical protein
MLLSLNLLHVVDIVSDLGLADRTAYNLFAAGISGVSLVDGQLIFPLQDCFYGE